MLRWSQALARLPEKEFHRSCPVDGYLEASVAAEMLAPAEVELFPHHRTEMISDLIQRRLAELLGS